VKKRGRPKKDDNVVASLTEIDGTPKKDDDVVASLTEIDGPPEKRIRIQRILHSQVDEVQNHRRYSKERLGAAQVGAGGIVESSTKNRQKLDGLQPASKKCLSKFPHSKRGPSGKFVSAQESAREQLLGAAQPQSVAVAVTPKVRHGRESGGQTKGKHAQWTAGKQRVRHTFEKASGTMAVVRPNLGAAGTAHLVQVIDHKQQKQIMEEEMGQKQILNKEMWQEVTEEMRQIANAFSPNSTQSIPSNFLQVCMLVHTYVVVCVCVHICVYSCGEG